MPFFYLLCATSMASYVEVLTGMKPVLLPLPYSARFYDTLAHIITERRYFAPRPSKVHACVCVCVCISQCICNTHTHTRKNVFYS